MNERRIILAIFSTGVLDINPNSTNTHLEVINLGTSSTTFRVLLKDPDAGGATIFNSGLVTLDSGEFAIFDEDISTLVHFEWRIRFPNGAKIVANCFGEDGSGTPQEGNTIYFKDWSESDILA